MGQLREYRLPSCFSKCIFFLCLIDLLLSNGYIERRKVSLVFLFPLWTPSALPMNARRDTPWLDPSVHLSDHGSVSVLWPLAELLCRVKGHQLDFWSEYIPKLRVWSPVGACTRSSRLMYLSHIGIFLPLLFSLPSPLLLLPEDSGVERVLVVLVRSSKAFPAPFIMRLIK